jgi:hypothetical protein
MRPESSQHKATLPLNRLRLFANELEFKRVLFDELAVLLDEPRILPQGQAANDCESSRSECGNCGCHYGACVHVVASPGFAGTD